MVNTKKLTPLAITIRKDTKKAQTIAIRLLGSPQATIHYGEVYAYKVQLTQHVLVL